MFFLPYYLVYNNKIIQSLPRHYDRSNAFMYLLTSLLVVSTGRISELKKKPGTAVEGSGRGCSEADCRQ